MSTSSSGSGATSHSTNPTTAKHQLVSPEGFLRPVGVVQRTWYLKYLAPIYLSPHNQMILVLRGLGAYS